MRRIILFSLFLVSFGFSWNKNGTPLVCDPGDQIEPIVLMPPGKDYFYLVYVDKGEGSIQGERVLSVKVDLKSGDLLWDTSIKACNSDSGMWQPDAVVTENGDLVIAFLDGRFGYNKCRLYISKISEDGEYKWGADGVPVCTLDNVAAYPRLALSPDGGCWVVWRDYRPDSSGIFVNRIKKDGTPVQENGKFIFRYGFYPLVVSSNKCAIVLWKGEKDGISGIYGQRFYPDLTPQWDSGGKLIISFYQPSLILESEREYPYAISDLKGGAIIYYDVYDTLNSENPYYTLFQRVDSLGNLLWSEMPKTEDAYYIASDDNSGVFVVWGRLRNWDYNYSEVYGTHIDSSSNFLWENPLLIWKSDYWDTTEYWVYPTATHDMHGGAIITWIESTEDGDELWGCRVDSSGDVKWSKILIDDYSEKKYPLVKSVSDSLFLIIWEDYRSEDCDIYGLVVTLNGEVVGIKESKESKDLLSFNSLITNGILKIKGDLGRGIRIELYDVLGRKVRSFEGRFRGGEVLINLERFCLSDGVYFIVLQDKSYVKVGKIIKIRR